jgi:hypothetical protein
MRDREVTPQEYRAYFLGKRTAENAEDTERRKCEQFGVKIVT